jgi:hypothetical protein
MGLREPIALIPEHRAKAQFVQDNGSRVLGGYLRAQFTLALIIGVLAGVGMSVLGLPYAVVLGVLAGLFELVPMFGPILSVIPAVIVALFMPFPTVIWVVLYFLLIQQLENTGLAPRISGHAVGLHPLGPMFALRSLQLADRSAACSRAAGWRGCRRRRATAAPPAFLSHASDERTTPDGACCGMTAVHDRAWRGAHDTQRCPRPLAD